jgi:hypothetical protein
MRLIIVIFKMKFQTLIVKIILILLYITKIIIIKVIWIRKLE